jgi:hypothetical protein
MFGVPGEALDANRQFVGHANVFAPAAPWTMLIANLCPLAIVVDPVEDAIPIVVAVTFASR